MSLRNRSKVEIGVVPTHLKFVGALAPDESGKLPRTRSGDLKVVSGMRLLCRTSPVKLNNVQITLFPGTDSKDLDDMFKGFRSLRLNVHLIMMVGGANPLNPKDEDAVVDMLNSGLAVAKKYKVRHVSSTSFEEWLAGRKLSGKAFDNAVKQVINVHARCFKESGLAKSSIEAWHLEFLRGVEFQNFTNAAKAATVVKGINKKIKKKFFKVMIDAAHCGDSDLTMEENEKVIKDLAKNDALGIFHASAKTTRDASPPTTGGSGPCLPPMPRRVSSSTLRELFHHQDPALARCRKAVKGHGVNTTDGRTYNKAVTDGIIDVTHRLNNLAARKLIA